MYRRSDPEWALTHSEAARRRQERSERVGTRVGAGCVWVGFALSAIFAVAAAALGIWLALAAIGWLERN